VNEGLPRHGRGLYPLAGCVQWYVAYWETRAKGRLGSEAKDEGQVLKNQLARTKLEEATGHLIPRKEVFDAQAAAYLRLGNWFDTLAASLAREFHWSGDVVKIVRARLDEAREDYARDVAEYLPPEAKADERNRRQS
jgi:hypothetical protein